MTARKKPVLKEPAAKVEYPTYKRTTTHTLEPKAGDSITLQRATDDPDVVVVAVYDGDGTYSSFGPSRSSAHLRLSRTDWRKLNEMFFRALGDETE
jgi:hypothetical protein